jgi:hypothetical protein
MLSLNHLLVWSDEDVLTGQVVQPVVGVEGTGDVVSVHLLLGDVKMSSLERSDSSSFDCPV